MGTMSYEQSAYEVRGDLAAAHARAWERLSRQGTWLNAAERISIAGEARAANDVRSAPSAKKPDRRLRSTAGTIPPPIA
jgi:hypothetical protein